MKAFKPNYNMKEVVVQDETGLADLSPRLPDRTRLHVEEGEFAGDYILKKGALHPDVPGTSLTSLLGEWIKIYTKDTYGIIDTETAFTGPGDYILDVGPSGGVTWEVGAPTDGYFKPYTVVVIDTLADSVADKSPLGTLTVPVIDTHVTSVVEVAQTITFPVDGHIGAIRLRTDLTEAAPYDNKFTVTVYDGPDTGSAILAKIPAIAHPGATQIEFVTPFEVTANNQLTFGITSSGANKIYIYTGTDLLDGNLTNYESGLQMEAYYVTDDYVVSTKIGDVYSDNIADDLLTDDIKVQAFEAPADGTLNEIRIRATTVNEYASMYVTISTGSIGFQPTKRIPVDVYPNEEFITVNIPGGYELTSGETYSIGLKNTTPSSVIVVTLSPNNLLFGSNTWDNGTATLQMLLELDSIPVEYVGRSEPNAFTVKPADGIVIDDNIASVIKVLPGDTLTIQAVTDTLYISNVTSKRTYPDEGNVLTAQDAYYLKGSPI